MKTPNKVWEEMAASLGRPAPPSFPVLEERVAKQQQFFGKGLQSSPTLRPQIYLGRGCSLGIILMLNNNHFPAYLSEPLISKAFAFCSLSLFFSSVGITFFSPLNSAVISD